MTARDDLLNSLLVERFTYLPENSPSVPQTPTVVPDWLAGPDRLADVELDLEIHALTFDERIAAIGLAS